MRGFPPASLIVPLRSRRKCASSVISARPHYIHDPVDVSTTREGLVLALVRI